MGSTGDGAFPAWLQSPRLCLSSETLGPSWLILVNRISSDRRNPEAQIVRCDVPLDFANRSFGLEMHSDARLMLELEDLVVRLASKISCSASREGALSCDMCARDSMGARVEPQAISGRPNNSLEATAASSGVYGTWVRLGMGHFQRGCSSRGCASALRR